MEDGKRLCEYDIPGKGNTMMLVLRLRGGARTMVTSRDGRRRIPFSVFQRRERERAIRAEAAAERRRSVSGRVPIRWSERLRQRARRLRRG